MPRQYRAEHSGVLSKIWQPAGRTIPLADLHTMHTLCAVPCASSASGDRSLRAYHYYDTLHQYCTSHSGRVAAYGRLYLQAMSVPDTCSEPAGVGRKTLPLAVLLSLSASPPSLSSYPPSLSSSLRPEAPAPLGCFSLPVFPPPATYSPSSTVDQSKYRTSHGPVSSYSLSEMLTQNQTPPDNA
eukprot:476653-Rhodomonas_salina.7